jgi:hypothetical protein
VTINDPETAPVIEHVPVETRPMLVHEVPERISADDDGSRITEHVLGWLREIADPHAMTRIVLSGVSRGTRRHVESLVSAEAKQMVWSVQVVNRGDLLAGLNERPTDLPSIDLMDLFDAFVRQGQESGRYDMPFTIEFAKEGRRALDDARRQLDAELSSEGGG